MQRRRTVRDPQPVREGVRPRGAPDEPGYDENG